MRAYIELCKPRVVALMLLTAIVGMLLATPEVVPWQIFVFGTVGIMLVSGAGAVINHFVDYKIDALMKRTKRRPIPTGRISLKHALLFAAIIGSVGILLLATLVNMLTAFLTFLTLMGYGVVYTVFLKHATPQNIVIGGLAGAMPPLLGWTAVTGQIDYGACLLVLIIFTWTPPHFWALSIARYQDYLKADVPMLPVTHGIRFTKLLIFLYTCLMFAITLLPFATGMSGSFYLTAAVALGFGFLYWSVRLYFSDEEKIAMNTFYYSIFYLMMLFIFLLLDHYINFKGVFSYV